MAEFNMIAPAYPEVKQVLDVLLAEIQSILGNQFIGMYLYGSLTTGDFDRASDVDFVIVTETPLSGPFFSALHAMHLRTAKLDNWCATQLEGSYIPRQALRHFDPQRVFYYHIDRGPGEELKRMQVEGAALSRAWWGGWVVLRSNLYESGITLAGPPPQTLVAPVTSEDLRQATLANLYGWAEPMLTNPAIIDSRGYQSYIVLTLCRMLYTLHFGKLVSKGQAADWAKGYLGKRWTGLIEGAWADRQTPSQPLTPQAVQDTLKFIQFVADHKEKMDNLMKPQMRNYKDENDFWHIRQFLREVMVANDFREFSWPVARLDYWRWHGIENCHSNESLEKEVILWETPDGQVAAVLNPEGNGNAFIQIHPAYKTLDLEEEIILTAMERLSNRGSDGKQHLSIWTDSQDSLRLDILKKHSFVRGKEMESQWRRDLDGPIEAAPVAEGYTIRSLGDASEIPARSWASWRGFHPNEPDEKYEGWEWYHNIQRCPLYRRDLDIVAVAPDGTIAAFATFWYDDTTRTAYIEPVATVPEHQRKGLARAAITEGLRRVQRMGCRRAFVSGMEAGPDALYSSTLSPTCDRYEEWIKVW
jgi:mycothiol synthase